MTAHPTANSEQLIRLHDDQLDRFAELGYLLLPSFLPEDLVDRLQLEVDRWVDDGLRARSIASTTDPRSYGPPPVLEVEMPAHGALVTHRPLLVLLRQLFGAGFAFHHLHSDRHAPDLPGKPWHHDFEQHPPAERRFGMIHALHYLNGIDDSTAPLVVLPRSHHTVAGKQALAHRGTDRLPGELVVDRLPSGSTVVLHSAVFHARRGKAGAGASRYFVDASYCEVGVRWPAVKVNWRDILRRATELGLSRDEWPELFAERHFSEYAKPV